MNEAVIACDTSQSNSTIIAPVVDAFREQINKLPEREKDPAFSDILKGPKRSVGTQWIYPIISPEKQENSEVYDDVEEQIEESMESGDDAVFSFFCSSIGIPFLYGPSPVPYQPNEQAIRRLIEEDVYEKIIKQIMFEEINENGTFLDFVSSIKQKDTNVFNYFSNLGLEKVEDLMHRARQEKIVMQNLYRI